MVASKGAAPLYPPLGAAASLPGGPALYVVTPTERGAWRPLWSCGSAPSGASGGGGSGPSWGLMATLGAAARVAEARLLLALSPVYPARDSPSSLRALTGAAGQGAKSGGGKRGPQHQPQQQHIFHGGRSLLSRLQATPAAVASSSPTSIFSPALYGAGGATPAFHAILRLKPGLLSRWGSDGRAFGPLKAPVALAAALEGAAWAVGVRAATPLPSAHGGAAAGAAVPPPSAALSLVASAHADKLTAPSFSSSVKGSDASRIVAATGTSSANASTLSGGAPATPPPSSQLILPLAKNTLVSSRAALLTCFDPLDLLLHGLRRDYGDHAWFFAAELPQAGGQQMPLGAGAGCGANAVGVVWKPGAFRAAAGTPSKPPSKGKAAGGGAAGTPPMGLSMGHHAQALALLPGLARLGAGLVRSVEVVGAASSGAEE